MSVTVIAELPLSVQGAQDFIDWSKSEDGYVLTRQFEGFNSIETWLAEDNKTVYLHQKWTSKEAHQAYLAKRVEGGLMDFLGPRLENEFKVTYFQSAD